MPKFKWLRSLGPLGNFIANALAFLTTSWALVVSVVVALLTGLISSLRAIALNPTTYVSVGAFLAVLWTLVGITTLIDRRRPRLVRSHQDYRYGLTFEGFGANFSPTNTEMPAPGTLQFIVLIRNYSPGPINYSVESYDVRIGTRAMPKYQPRTISGYMARGAGRQARAIGFPGGTLAEFYGKGMVEGTADFVICYGPPDGPAVRRLKVSLNLYMVFPKDGIVDVQKNVGFGCTDNIISEVDEAID
jgi:hypothetical protein